MTERIPVKDGLHHGLHRLDEIDYAVIERTGALSIIPKKGRAG